MRTFALLPRLGCASLLALGALSISSAAFAAQPSPSALSVEDIRWLDRITYGADTPTVDLYKTLGRQKFLETQLAPHPESLPPRIQTLVHNITVGSEHPEQLIEQSRLENQRINAMPDGDDKTKARQAEQQAMERMAQDVMKRHWARAIYSSNQLQEQMVGFWLNHFSLYRYKANLRWTIGDFEEAAIRAHALGNFRDLLLATIEHPAMLVYLDNAQSANGKINENYARELLELHTMGVGSGYSQQDVQELARILTGVGVEYTTTPPQLRPQWQPLLRWNKGFLFNPARHDFGDKVFLGHTIHGQGFAEVEQAVDLIVNQPATAHFIAHKLAAEFVSDDPPPALVDRMAQTFRQTHGDIASVLRVMFNAPEFTASLGKKFKDPQHYVVSALRLAYDSQSTAGVGFSNFKPVLNMLNSMGQSLFGHLTPEGYGERASDWDSSGQMAKRFEIAKWIGSGNAGLFDPDDGTPATATGFPQLSNKLYFETVEPLLDSATRNALTKASNQTEWNAYLLASPAFMYR